MPIKLLIKIKLHINSVGKPAAECGLTIFINKLFIDVFIISFVRMFTHKVPVSVYVHCYFEIRLRRKNKHFY